MGPMKSTRLMGFSSHPPRFLRKTKTTAKSAVTRVNLLRNKRQTVVRQMRRDIALLLHFVSSDHCFFSFCNFCKSSRHLDELISLCFIREINR
ncbi:hypothetical protein L1987_11607 [Smallanthus sonchifolius]|uniref:Uncharacterized protein n=1 Tax=Smallanthus sonchifolius TaxID=185202 RepID=A0ACB9JBH4_9ASTR|nr:hypothetical protein L1987_11607 [Smallanthus sonchifolius]